MARVHAYARCIRTRAARGAQCTWLWGKLSRHAYRYPTHVFHMPQQRCVALGICFSEAGPCLLARQPHAWTRTQALSP